MLFFSRRSMPPSRSTPGLSRRRSTPVHRTRPLPGGNEAARCQWDPDPYHLPFDRTATRLINSKSSEAWSLRKEMYFLLYGCVCFALVPITAHILVPSERFLQWYATNIAVLPCDYYFKTGIQGFGIMFVSLIAMVFAGNDSSLEMWARNGAGLAVWIIFFVRMSEGMLRDAALHMGLLYRGDRGALIPVLQQPAVALGRYPQQALKWGIVIEFEVFIAIYAFTAIRKFRQVRNIDRSCTNLLNWRLLLRQIHANTNGGERSAERF